MRNAFQSGMATLSMNEARPTDAILDVLFSPRVPKAVELASTCKEIAKYLKLQIFKTLFKSFFIFYVCRIYSSFLTNSFQCYFGVISLPKFSIHSRSNLQRLNILKQYTCSANTIVCKIPIVNQTILQNIVITDNRHLMATKLNSRVSLRVIGSHVSILFIQHEKLCYINIMK